MKEIKDHYSGKEIHNIQNISEISETDKDEVEFKDLDTVTAIHKFDTLQSLPNTTKKPKRVLPSPPTKPIDHNILYLSEYKGYGKSIVLYFIASAKYSEYLKVSSEYENAINQGRENTEIKSQSILGSFFKKSSKKPSPPNFSDISTDRPIDIKQTRDDLLFDLVLCCNQLRMTICSVTVWHNIDAWSDEAARLEEEATRLEK